MFSDYASASIKAPRKLGPGKVTIGFDREYADPDGVHSDDHPSLVHGPCKYQASYHGVITGLAEGQLVTVTVEEMLAVDGAWQTQGPPTYERTEHAALDPAGRYTFTAVTLTSSLPKGGRVWLPIDTHGAEATLATCQGTIAYG